MTGAAGLSSSFQPVTADPACLSLWGCCGERSPLQRYGGTNIEYVPTQIVTEYFRRVFRTADGGPIDGLNPLPLLTVLAVEFVPYEPAVGPAL
jgi:hypothetical protein